MKRGNGSAGGRSHPGTGMPERPVECREAHAWIEDEASGALGARELGLLRLHADSCAACRARRARADRLVRDLALTFAAVRTVDVRRRVMEEVLAEAQEAALRARVGWHAFWTGMVAAAGIVCLLALQARRAASTLPGEALAEGHLFLRLGLGGWTAVRSTAAALTTLALGLLDAAVHVLGVTASSLLTARQAALWVVSLILVASAVPVVRALRPGRYAGPMRILMGALLAFQVGSGAFAAQKIPTPPDPPVIRDESGAQITIELHDDGEDAVDPDDDEAHITGRVKMNVVRNVTVEEGEVHKDDLVVVGGTAVVRGEVRGDVVVVGGKLELNGRVKGNAVAFMTDTTVGDDARVGGDLVHLGGSFEASPEAKVGGETFHADLPGLAFGAAAREAADGAFTVVYLARLLMFAILFWAMLIIVCVAPARITSMGEALGRNWGRAIMLGLLAYAATCVLGFIFLILSLLLIGLPLLAMLGFAWLVVEAMGLAAILWLLGDRVVRNLSRRELAPAVAFLIGFAIYLPTQIVPFHWGFLWMVIAILGHALHICATVLAIGLTLATQFDGPGRLGFRKHPPQAMPAESTASSPPPPPGI